MNLGQPGVLLLYQFQKKPLRISGQGFISEADVLLITRPLMSFLSSTHPHPQPFYGSLDSVWDNLGELVPNIHPLTHILIINHTQSASYIYCNPWHPPSSLYLPDSLFAQCLSKFSLVYLLVWHPPLYTPYIPSLNHCLLFHSTCPYHRNMFCCSTEIISSNPSLPLNSLLGTLIF